MFDYTVWMILDGIPVGTRKVTSRNDHGGFELAVQQEVLDFICTHGQRLKEISPRMAWKLALRVAMIRPGKMPGRSNSRRTPYGMG